jgi:chemotaxis protein CheX
MSVMNRELIEIFINSTMKVLETMAFVKPKAGQPVSWDDNSTVGEVVGIVGLSNEEKKIKGFLSVGFSEDSIIQIVSNMLGEEFESINSDVREAAGEIANMISGQARQVLTEKGFKLHAALPTVVSGKDLVLQTDENKPFTMVPFEIEKGLFEIGICLEKAS